MAVNMIAEIDYSVTPYIEPETLEKIEALKKELKAVILAHNYQLPELQVVADFVGDSLELAIKASQLENIDHIFFCGVHFMAETAAILNPDARVIIPDPKAGCPLADMIEPEDVMKLKEKYKGDPVVAYVNTSAAVKAEVDICCTSSNALKVVEALEADEVVFVPDKNLAEFVASKTTKRIISWDGFCPTHMRFTVEDIERARVEHPEAAIVVHPECRREVQLAADFILSTGGMYRLPEETDIREFVIGTETGMLFRLKRTYPNREFYPLNERAFCPNMKKNTLEKLVAQMETPTNIVSVDRETAEKAKKSIERMIAIV